MRIRDRLNNFWDLLKQTSQWFIEDRCLKLSASLSYYTLFSIGPLLLLILVITGSIWGADAVEGKMFYQLKSVLGSDVALQLQKVISNTRLSQDGNLLGLVIGGLVLLIGATGVFTEIQDSINFIWSLKAKPKKGWVKWLGNRLLSMTLIATCGFLLLVSLTINMVLDMLGDYLERYFEDVMYYVFYTLNTLLVLGVISILFAIVFKVLPDGKIRWKDTWAGAIFTAFLFMLGKFLIGFYISKSSVGATYGAAASVLLLLTWIYYTSIILYFGAEFTKAWSLMRGEGIKPNDTAVFIMKQEAKEMPDILNHEHAEKLTETEKKIEKAKVDLNDAETYDDQKKALEELQEAKAEQNDCKLEIDECKRADGTPCNEEEQAVFDAGKNAEDSA